MGRLNRKRNEDARHLKVVLKAIAKQCLECAGGTVLERKFCQCECALWPYRFGGISVDPALLDKKNFAEGAIFGFDKEAVKCEAAFRKSEKSAQPKTRMPFLLDPPKSFPCKLSLAAKTDRGWYEGTGKVRFPPREGIRGAVKGGFSDLAACNDAPGKYR